MLTPDEALNIVKLARQYDRWIGDPDDLRLTAMAWLSALDMRLTVDQAATIVSNLAAINARIGPGTINEAFLRTIRAPHEQVGRPKLVGEKQENVHRAPLEIGAPMPALPQDVPGYTPRWSTADHRILATKCPHCGALRGERCFRLVAEKREPLKRHKHHPAREEAAQMALAGAGTGA